jgi:hypothetical protein
MEEGRLQGLSGCNEGRQTVQARTGGSWVQGRCEWALRAAERADNPYAMDVQALSLDSTTIAYGLSVFVAKQFSTKDPVLTSRSKKRLANEADASRHF